MINLLSDDRFRIGTGLALAGGVGEILDVAVVSSSLSLQTCKYGEKSLTLSFKFFLPILKRYKYDKHALCDWYIFTH